MGVCTSDPLGHLTNEYGDDVGKYFVSVKAEEYLDQIVPKMTLSVEERFFNCSNNLNQQFDAKEQTIRKYFDDILTQTLKESRAALEGIKQKEKKNEEEIFGLTNIHLKFKKIRANKDQKVKNHQQNLIKILNQKKNDLQQQIINNRPSLPILQKMPFWLKSQVEADGGMKFERELKMQEQKLLIYLQKSINLQSLQDSIQRQAGMEEADELGKAANAAFQRIKRNIAYYNNPRSCFI